MIDLLVKHFSDIVDYEFTAKMEDDLDKIASHSNDWHLIIKNFYKPFKKNLMEKENEITKKNLGMEQTTDQKCDKCGSPMIIKMGRFGKFLACSGYPDCKNIKPIVKSTGVKCPECGKGEIVEKKTKKGKTFFACDQYPNCKNAYWSKPTGEKCPKCGSLMVYGKENTVVCSNKECK